MSLTCRQRMLRLTAVILAGGTVVQLAGCATGLAPVFLSFLESTALRALLAPIVSP